MLNGLFESSCDSYQSYFTSVCWPSARTLDQESISSDGDTPELSDFFLPLDYPESEQQSIKNIRATGYALVLELFAQVELANQQLIKAQWQQFEKEIIELQFGDRDPKDCHETPNLICFHGEAYGSFPMQLMELVEIINTEESPFYTQLPRLAKATDQIPPLIQEKIKKIPQFEKGIKSVYQKSCLERMLSSPILKSGASNGLTLTYLDDLIHRLEMFYPRAKLLDEVNGFKGKTIDKRHRLIFLLEDAQVKLIKMRKELSLNQKLMLQDVAMLAKAKV